jgi:hypothetical protein
MIDRLKVESTQLRAADRASKLEVSKLTDVIRELHGCIKLMIEAADATANKLYMYISV